jgi:hypothetical protein
MFETISLVGATALACGYPHQLMRGNSGVSAESRALEKAATQMVSKSREAVSIDTAKNALVSRLWEMAEECGENDWNGYEAAPLSLAAVEQAVEFIRAWPFEDDLPDCAPEPDGSVNLEWIYTRHRRATVSLDGGQRLAFAWLDGANKGRGVAAFQNGKMPHAILDSVRGIRGR